MDINGLGGADLQASHGALGYVKRTNKRSYAESNARSRASEDGDTADVEETDVTETCASADPQTDCDNVLKRLLLQFGPENAERVRELISDVKINYKIEKNCKRIVPAFRIGDVHCSSFLSATKEISRLTGLLAKTKLIKAKYVPVTQDDAEQLRMHNQQNGRRKSYGSGEQKQTQKQTKTKTPSQTDEKEQILTAEKLVRLKERNRVLKMRYGATVRALRPSAVAYFNALAEGPDVTVRDMLIAVRDSMDDLVHRDLHECIGMIDLAASGGGDENNNSNIKDEIADKLSTVRECNGIEAVAAEVLLDKMHASAMPLY